MKKILLLFLSFIAGQTIAQNVEIDTISYGLYGGKVVYTDTYYFTQKAIIKRRVYSDLKKGTKKVSIANSTENWNSLLSKMNIDSFSKIKSGDSRADHCGVDTYIMLKLKNGKKITVINGNDKMLDEIQKEILKFKNKIDRKYK